MMYSAVVRFHDAYGAFLKRCGIFAGTVTFLMMLLVVINAILRYTVNYSVPGALEFTESMLTILIFLSLALTQYENGHIQVVLFTRRFPPPARRAIKALAMLLGLVFFSWCCLGAWREAVTSYTINEHEWGAVRFPIYPVKFVLLFGLLLLAVQFALDLLFQVLGMENAGDKDAPRGSSPESS